jgi:hypothetical protein
MKLYVDTGQKNEKTQSTGLNCCFLMHLTYVLCKLSVVEYTYQSID